MRAGARVVAKAYPEERVGVFARRDGRIEVVEYSELDPQEAAATHSGARLTNPRLNSHKDVCTGTNKARVLILKGTGNVCRVL